MDSGLCNSLSEGDLSRRDILPLGNMGAVCCKFCPGWAGLTRIAPRPPRGINVNVEARKSL
jgi:hypothetical protein